METDLIQVIENQNQIIELLNQQNTYLYYIEGFFLFIVIVVLCVFAYRFFNMFFKF